MKKRLVVLTVLALNAGAPRSEGYTNPVDFGNTETVTNDRLVGGNLYVGQNTPNNTRVVTNWGKVDSAAGYIGQQGSSGNNAAIVTGPDSAWINSGQFNVGYQGSDVQLK
jgi:T5SS/PEP-CTERM-associated repeat protein